MARLLILSLVLGSMFLPIVVARASNARQGLVRTAVLASLMIVVWVGAMWFLVPRVM